MSLTKIIATVGPAIEEKSTLVSLIKSGVRVFRFNLKYSDHKWHSSCIQKVRQASKEAGHPVAVLLDLQGPEVRIGELPRKKVKVKKSQEVFFFDEENPNPSKKSIPISKSFFQDGLKKDGIFFIDEGLIKFKVLKRKGGVISAKVLKGGVIRSKKGVNIPGIELSFSSLLAKDMKDLSLGNKHEIDYIALSFVRRKKDIELLKKEIKKLSLSAKILAKIETPQALENFEEILESSHGVMIARGDLGIEIPLEQVPYYQKKIIKRCVEVGKPVITATQMLDSMSKNSLPTRAEVSDVANAVLDYTATVMLSKETAVGKYPLKTVSVTKKICSFWEKKRSPPDNFNYELNHQTASVCYSAYRLWRSPFCQKEKVRAFVAVTKTGMTAQMISRLRPNLPILGLTNDEKVRDQLCLLYGVTPVFIKTKGDKLYKKRSTTDISKILDNVKKSGYVKKGEKVIIIYAEDWGTGGKTSIVRIQEVP